MKKSTKAGKKKGLARKLKAAGTQPDLNAVKKYVDDQIELLKQHGTRLKISDADYDSVVNKVAEISSFGQKII